MTHRVVALDQSGPLLLINRLTYKHLNNNWKLATAQDVTPQTDGSVKAKMC